jgi:hypothetical protein
MVFYQQSGHTAAAWAALKGFATARLPPKLKLGMGTGNAT